MKVPKSFRLIFSTLLLVLELAACSRAPTPTAYFKVAVIVDTTTDPVSREQAEAILAISNEQLIELTGFGLQIIDFVEEDSGVSMAKMVADYMNFARELPNGILIFSVGDEDRAKINRAYAQQIPAPDGFRNAFDSPYLGSGYMYVAVLQFNYQYAACGYGGMDTIQGPGAIGDECRGEEGTVCAEWEGMQVCPVALPFLAGHTPIDMAAGPVIHEFMHAFGDRGPDDHYGSEACNFAMGWEPDHFDSDESEFYAGFCPDVFEAFADSYQP